MLVALLIYLLKKRFSRRRFSVRLLCNICCVATAPFLSIAANSQETKLSYNIIKSGKVIGRAVAIKTVQGTTTKYHLSTDTKARYIVSIEISTREESVFDNGMLIRSAFSQKNNGNVKVNTQVRWDGSAYQFINNGETATSKDKYIMANMMMLFFSIPGPSLSVFTDHFQTFIPMEKINAEEYKTTLPNGTEKHFIYKNGICRRLQIKSTFYDIAMELVL